MSTPPSLHRVDSARSSSSSRPAASVGDAKHQEELIQSLEAEEERLVNTLTRKLEKLRAEKVELENVLEAESESLVLRLQRQLQDLMRQQQQQQQQQAPQPASQSLPSSIVTATPADSAPSPNFTSLLPGQNPLQPSSETLIQALKTENSTLRNRLVDTEREFIKTSRQSDSYRSELITLRQRAGIAIDDLVGTGAAFEEGPPPPSVARRWSRTHSTGMSGIPIPGSLQRRPVGASGSPSSPGMSLGQVSSLSLPSSTPLSPTTDSSPNSNSPRDTTLTTPSGSYPGLPVPFSTPVASPAGPRAGYLGTTPASISVPPPPPPSAASSLARSYGLPSHTGDLTPDSGAATPLSQSPASRSGSVSRGTSSVRVAETGVLLPRRSRVGSVGAPGAPEDRRMPSS